MTVGFVALWRNNQREYAASPRDEWGTTERIQGAFARGRERGNRTYGLYFCRWSSAWQYMTFWVSPSLAAVFDTIADLERAGDFKFADSLHVFGRFDGNDAFRTPGAWDDVPEPVDGMPPPAGAFLAERGGARSRVDGLAADSRLAPIVAEHGVRMYGRFDCRFSSGWDRFMYWTAPDAAAVAAALDRCERELGPDLPELEVVTGRLDRYFRFGNHLQTELTWLNEESPER